MTDDMLPPIDDDDMPPDVLIARDKVVAAIDDLGHVNASLLLCVILAHYAKQASSPIAAVFEFTRLMGEELGLQLSMQRLDRPGPAKH